MCSCSEIDCYKALHGHVPFTLPSLLPYYSGTRSVDISIRFRATRSRQPQSSAHSYNKMKNTVIENMLLFMDTASLLVPCKRPEAKGGTARAVLSSSDHGCASAVRPSQAAFAQLFYTMDVAEVRSAPGSSEVPVSLSGLPGAIVEILCMSIPRDHTRRRR